MDNVNIKICGNFTDMKLGSLASWFLEDCAKAIELKNGSAGNVDDFLRDLLNFEDEDIPYPYFDADILEEKLPSFKGVLDKYVDEDFGFYEDFDSSFLDILDTQNIYFDSEYCRVFNGEIDILVTVNDRRFLRGTYEIPKKSDSHQVDLGNDEQIRSIANLFSKNHGQELGLADQWIDNIEAQRLKFNALWISSDMLPPAFKSLLTEKYRMIVTCGVTGAQEYSFVTDVFDISNLFFLRFANLENLVEGQSLSGQNAFMHLGYKGTLLKPKEIEDFKFGCERFYHNL